MLLETSGGHDIGGVDGRVVKIVDVKCPGSGESGANRWSNLTKLGARDELKFVIADRPDYEWALGVVREHGLAGTRPIHFSPAEPLLRLQELGSWILDDGLDVRLHYQLHKLIWPGRTRGI